MIKKLNSGNPSAKICDYVTGWKTGAPEVRRWFKTPRRGLNLDLYKHETKCSPSGSLGIKNLFWNYHFQTSVPHRPWSVSLNISSNHVRKYWFKIDHNCFHVITNSQLIQSLYHPTLRKVWSWKASLYSIHLLSHICSLVRRCFRIMTVVLTNQCLEVLTEQWHIDNV
jgi:hypothetical protein